MLLLTILVALFATLIAMVFARRRPLGTEGPPSRSQCPASSRSGDGAVLSGADGIRRQSGRADRVALDGRAVWTRDRDGAGTPRADPTLLAVVLAVRARQLPTRSAIIVGISGLGALAYWVYFVYFLTHFAI